MTKTKKTLQAQLIEHGACKDGLAWAKQFKTLADLWDKCQRADWMIWGLEKAGIKDERKFRLFACWCVRNTPLPRRLAGP